MGFWRTRIPGFRQIVNPFYQVTPKNYFDWGPEKQQTFEGNKEEIGGGVALGAA